MRKKEQPVCEHAPKAELLLRRVSVWHGARQVRYIMDDDAFEADARERLIVHLD
jgi:hypothetical protein